MFKEATDRRVAVFLADGLEEVEGLTVIDLLFRAGIPCDKVSVSRSREVTSSHQVTLVCDCTVHDAGFSFDDYDMLVLPGGIPGTPNLKACDSLAAALVRFAREGRQIAAICAAPSILAELGLLTGRRATSNPNFQHVLVEHGAELCEHDPVVVDGNIITSQGMGTAIAFGLQIVRHFLGDEAVEHVSSGIVLHP